MKKLSKLLKKDTVKSITLTKFHDFSEEQVTKIRQQLLQWYDQNKRDLPWRKQNSTANANQKAYSVWVSEIMLQQTQVVTVIDYYNRWMKKWPTVEDLAEADIEEVNEVWSGLGYYSRARRLHEAANKVVQQLKGEMPRTAADLLHHLPGVGRYTAAAVASISFNEPVGVVDGNVVRVLSRLRAIGANSGDPQVVDVFWQLSDKLVSPDQPGDFNQGLMELGATVCTPKSPSCSSCPLQNTCHAYTKKMKNDQLASNTLLQRTQKDNIVDIECVAQDCHLCLPSTQPWDNNLGVTNYPRKAPKKAPREQTSAVFIIQRSSSEGPQFLMCQRPKTGLLAGLWEFPTLNEVNEAENNEALFSRLENFGLKTSLLGKRSKVGDVLHIFSHIRQTYSVEAIDYTSKSPSSDHRPVGISTVHIQWMTGDQLKTSAISTAMKKVFKIFEDFQKNTSSLHKKPSTKHKINGDERQTKRQRSLMDSYFKSSTAPTT